MGDWIKIAFEFLISNDHPVVAALFVMLAGVVYALRFIWMKYDKLRVDASNEIAELQSSMKELQESYSNSNNKTADTLDKIGQTILKLANLTAKREG